MLEKIVLTPSIEGTDYLKSLANLGEEAKNTFCVRYMRSLELARYLMQRSGVSCPQEFVNNTVLAAKMYHKVKDIDYFHNSSFGDVFNLIKSVNNLRICIPSNEAEEIKKLLTTETFKRKNEAVVEFYNSLIKLLNEENLIDEIGFIRYAINNSKPINNVEFIRYEEFEYSKLDIELFNKAAGKVVTPVQLTKDQKPVIKSYVKAFSQNSEIEDILAYIYREGIKFDECLIAASDTNTYGKILSNYQAALRFPLVINSGQSINDTSSGRLFRTVCTWMANNNHLDYFNELLYSREFNLDKFKDDIGNYNDEVAKSINNQLGLKSFDVFSFDSIVNTVGNLKLGLNDLDKNNQRLEAYKQMVESKPEDKINRRDRYILEYVEKINEIFSKGIANFLENYAILDENNISIEKNALGKYLLALELIDKYDIDINEMIRFLTTVVIGSRKPQPGSLFVTSINNSIPFLRKHLFVVGLDSKAFPGKVAEDPIILDQDYDLYEISEASTRQMKENKRSYNNLINLASSKGVDIHLSYAYYNSETAKVQNASSVLFETYQKEVGEDKTVTVNDFNKEFGNGDYKLIGFFDNDLFPLSVLGRKNKDTIIVKSDEVQPSETANVDATPLMHRLSATAIEKYVECQYKFFLNSVLHIGQENDTDIFKIVPDNDSGTIAHEIMEHFTADMSRDEFLELSEQKFKEYLIAHPSDNPQTEQALLDDFKKMMSNAYDMEMEDKKPSVFSEEEVYAEFGDLKLKGRLDKVEKVGTDTYRVVDYKTGNKIKHDAKEKDTFIQGAMYAYLLLHGKNKLNKGGTKPIVISEVVFRYLKSKVKVSSEDGVGIQECLNYLEEVLNQISNSVKTGEFLQNGKCESCYFKSVCGGKK